MNEKNAQTSGDEIENHRNIRLLPTECGDVDGNKIIGGTTAGLFEFPWMALISYKYSEWFEMLVDPVCKGIREFSKNFERVWF